ncbi:hypothetical protein BH09VER1_BH09VER1_56030 [soil metagenome]
MKLTVNVVIFRSARRTVEKPKKSIRKKRTLLVGGVWLEEPLQNVGVAKLKMSQAENLKNVEMGSLRSPVYSCLAKSRGEIPEKSAKSIRTRKANMGRLANGHTFGEKNGGSKK